MKLPPVLVSRADRIGDLILSLPALGALRRAGFSERILHVAPYCRAIAKWALANELCTGIWESGTSAPGFSEPPVALSLVYLTQAAQELRQVRPRMSVGPRSKISALWNFSHSIVQHRSRVEKSEMAYNLDLVDALCARMGLPAPGFKGLPALRIPSDWFGPKLPPSPDVLLVVSNRGSASNWPLDRYLDWGRAALRKGQRVDFLVNGSDAEERFEVLRKSGIADDGATLLRDLPSLQDLIAYLSRCGHVVCSSTGPLHIAHAAGVPVTGIYPTVRVQSFARWRPAGYWHGAPVRYLEI